MRTLILLAGLAVGIAGCAGSSAPASSPLNPFSGEDRPLRLAMLAPSAGFTLAQTQNTAGQSVTLLVTAMDEATVEAIDLSSAGAQPGTDIFEAVAAVGVARLSALQASPVGVRRYPLADLLSPAGAGDRHIASGTNFIEHQQEADIASVFNFPKFGPASPAMSTVRLKDRVLLDYEVEICVRFDRPIGSLEDFDAAMKGFFVCGDFSDRAMLVERIDRSNVASGIGFSDAKSGPDFFPTGPVLVIPHDWASFVDAERMITQVNGQMRQDARGHEMILDFRELTAKALNDRMMPRYVHQGRNVMLFSGAAIPRGAVLMSGTSEGVIFRLPAPEDYEAGRKAVAASGAPPSEEAETRAVLDAFINRELAAGRYLRPGDIVEHAASSMGRLEVKVIEDR